MYPAGIMFTPPSKLTIPPSVPLEDPLEASLPLPELEPPASLDSPPSAPLPLPLPEPLELLLDALMSLPDELLPPLPLELDPASLPGLICEGLGVDVPHAHVAMGMQTRISLLDFIGYAPAWPISVSSDTLHDRECRGGAPRSGAVQSASPADNGLQGALGCYYHIKA